MDSRSTSYARKPGAQLTTRLGLGTAGALLVLTAFGAAPASAEPLLDLSVGGDVTLAPVIDTPIYQPWLMAQLGVSVKG